MPFNKGASALLIGHETKKDIPMLFSILSFLGDYRNNRKDSFAMVELIDITKLLYSSTL